MFLAASSFHSTAGADVVRSGMVHDATRRWSVLVQARPRHTFAYRSLLTVPFLSGSVAVPETTTTTTHGAAATTNGTLLHVLCVFLDHRGLGNRRIMIGCACFIILANIATAASLPPLSNPLISQSSSYSTTCRTLDMVDTVDMRRVPELRYMI